MREDVRDIVGCPRCHAPLSSASREPAALVCASAGCALSNAAFPIVAGCPVLIDFEDSIVQQAALEARMGASSIARSTGWTARLRDLLIGGNTVAAANCQAFVDELRGKSANPRILVIGGGLT